VAQRLGSGAGCAVWPTGYVGYLLKDRVADADEFVDALARVGAGGTALSFEQGSSSPIRRCSKIATRALDVHATETVIFGDNVNDAGALGARVHLLLPVAGHAERGLKEICAICTP
jgi:hypothetical protein